jgi:hypothetical protein
MAPKASHSRSIESHTRNVLPGNYKNKKHAATHSRKPIHISKVPKVARRVEAHSPSSVVFGDTRIYAGYTKPSEHSVKENRFVIVNIPDNAHIFVQQRRRSQENMRDVLREVRTEVLVRKLSNCSDDVEVDETEMFQLD